MDLSIETIIFLVLTTQTIANSLNDDAIVLEIFFIHFIIKIFQYTTHALVDICFIEESSYDKLHIITSNLNCPLEKSMPHLSTRVLAMWYV